MSAQRKKETNRQTKSHRQPKAFKIHIALRFSKHAIFVIEIIFLNQAKPYIFWDPTAIGHHTGSFALCHCAVGSFQTTVGGNEWYKTTWIKKLKVEIKLGKLRQLISQCGVLWKPLLILSLPHLTHIYFWFKEGSRSRTHEKAKSEVVKSPCLCFCPRPFLEEYSFDWWEWGHDACHKLHYLVIKCTKEICGGKIGGVQIIKK